MLDPPEKTPSPTNVQRFLCERDVIAIAGFGSRSAFRKEVAEKRFPPPIRISSGRIAWAEHEIARWQAERIAARDLKT